MRSPIPKALKKPFVFIGEFINFIALFVGAHATSVVALWVAYTLASEVLKLDERHAILLALLPILWIQMIAERTSKN